MVCPDSAILDIKDHINLYFDGFYVKHIIVKILKNKKPYNIPIICGQHDPALSHLLFVYVND